MEKNPKVVVAMSGGVDSSTVAAILKSQGYDVEGLTMLLSDDIDNESLLNGVKDVAGQLEIQHHVKDFRNDFRSEVIDYFIQSYDNGLTPNPCVVCNQRIKFGRMLEEAKLLGADYLATGHYARLVDSHGTIKLLKGLDDKKDQSYFLYRLKQSQLRHLIFPLGELTKVEVRKKAAEFDLTVANKAESQDLCFIAKGDYRDFLQTNSTISSIPGPIVDTTGKGLGVHKGLWNYTVGQRRGLGVAHTEPLYVVRLDVKNNTLVVADSKNRGKDRFIAQNINFIDGVFSRESFKAKVKIRYTAKETGATIKMLSEDKAEIHLEKSLPDITPGQSVVFYLGDELLGGGYIE